MRYGIYDVRKVNPNEEVVICNYCDHFFYEEITDERNTNSLELFLENNHFFKGCPVCKTDDYLADVDLQEIEKYL